MARGREPIVHLKERLFGALVRGRPSTVAGPTAESQSTQIKTTSVSSIKVTPHFIVSSGNGVVTEEKVIC